MTTLDKHHEALRPSVRLTRRGFAKAGLLATGFSMAAGPIRAETITTPSTGLVTGEVEVPTYDGAIPAYRAHPDANGTFPVILVVQEIFGIHEHIRDICRRFAQRGYYAIAPSLYHRQGDPLALTEFQAIVDLAMSVPDGQVMRDLDLTVAYASDSGKGDADRLGITGFCWGGRITWLYAAHNPLTRAGVAWYGSLVGVSSQLQPRHPVDIAASLQAPVLGLYGDADGFIPVPTVDAMRNALREAGKDDSELVVYPGGNHGFHADYRPSYQRDLAMDAWSRCTGWFARHGVI